MLSLIRRYKISLHLTALLLLLHPQYGNPSSSAKPLTAMYRGFFDDLSPELSPKKQKQIGFKGDIPPYVLPVLYPLDGNLKKRWFIKYSCWDENANDGEGGLVEKQKRVPTKLKTLAEREKWATTRMAYLNNALKLGRRIRKKEKPKHKPEHFKQEELTISDALLKVYEIVKFNVSYDTGKDYRIAQTDFRVWLADNNYDKIKLKDMTKELVTSYLDEYQSTNNVANITRNNRRRNLSAMFSQLVDKGYTKENVFFQVQFKKETEPQKHPLSIAHLSMILPVLHLFKHRQLWQACQFIYYLYIRPSELEHLKVSQVDFETLNVMIPNTNKSKKARYPDISPDFEALLKEMKLHEAHPDWYVFGSTGYPGPSKRKRGYFTKKFASVRDQLELPKQYTYYCWKHTGALHFLMDGGSLIALKEQMGHESLATTELYARSIGYKFNLEIRAKQTGTRLRIT